MDDRHVMERVKEDIIDHFKQGVITDKELEIATMMSLISEPAMSFFKDKEIRKELMASFLASFLVAASCDIDEAMFHAKETERIIAKLDKFVNEG